MWTMSQDTALDIAKVNATVFPRSLKYYPILPDRQGHSKIFHGGLYRTGFPLVPGWYKIMWTLAC